ncbi:Cyanate hydratase [Apophysomyces ossiformis]|uniref:Cyanate hydratase n=1 Tax=Apophysomyces ossiformis TaxID=679940 RepID=A0A8H7BTK4_9FUNG|nr:Cyanate hydratase [Apophysomyces ossiformis]
MATHPKLSALQQRMFAAKAERKLTFEEIGRKINHDEVYVAAIFYGQAKPTAEELETLSKVLNIPPGHLKDDLGSHFYPDRGGLVSYPPADPTIYRLYEMMNVYAYPLKSVIHEKFGDGIMSAVDFNARVDKVKDATNGDRVVITLDGKFLPYKKW